MKQKCFDRKNCRALENKVNHCRRMPEVDKWGDRNVSTTSAVCFLCWEFFFLCLYCSLSLISLLCLSHPSSPCYPVFTAFFSCTLSLFLFITGSLPSLAFTVKFHLWGVTGPGKLCVSWQSVTTNKTTDWFNIYFNSAEGVETFCCRAAVTECLKFISSWTYTITQWTDLKCF